MSPTQAGGRGTRRGRPSPGTDDGAERSTAASVPLVRRAGRKGWAQPLPRGRHKLPQEAVEDSQRQRLLLAMAELVGERGYGATTVPDVIAAARVSSNTFYRFFTDKTACFLALSEQLGDQLFDQLAAFETDAATPQEALAALDAGLRAYLRWWSDQPAMARAYFVELPMAGPRAMAARERQYRRFETIHRRVAERARALSGDAPPLRDVDVSASVILTTELVAREVRAGRVRQLAAIEDDMRYVLLKLLAGDQVAELARRRRTPLAPSAPAARRVRPD
ncbi:MAG: TetR/AcrR family transcriptional regulator [bacterium]|nr:TetR/AcrR family transcriptional regulator [bacterium]